MQQRRKKERPTRASSKERKPLMLSPKPDPEAFDGGGMDLPQGFADETSLPSKRSSSRRRKQDSGGNGWIFGFVFLLGIVVVASYYLVAHHEEQQLNHLREEIVHDQVDPLSREWEEKYADLLEENQKLVTVSEQFSALKEGNERMQEQQHQATKLRQNLDTRIEYLAKYRTTIQESIQAMHKAVLLEKFGPGPHHVEINLQFDPAFPKAQDTDTDTGRMVIALAPVDEMPHTVYFFLEQVAHKLYDGTSFHRNAGHVIQGGPAPNFLTKPNSRLQLRFEESGFESVLFQEFSPNFPHEKYTLGMAGRPGGPDFYVSTRNNTDLHGPGGQTSYEDPSEADPCFAKVIEGQEWVDRMQLGPVKPGGYKALEDNVAITSMRILSDTDGDKEKGLEKQSEAPERTTDLPEKREEDEIPDHSHDLPDRMNEVPDHVNDLPEGMKDE